LGYSSGVAEDTRGQFLYDMVTACLASQAADYAALVGRAKDLLGVASITTLVTGVLANDKITNVARTDTEPWVFVAVALALVAVVACAFTAMQPRDLYLSPAPADVAATVSSNPSWDVDTYYASVAMGFILEDFIVVGESAIDHNRAAIDSVRRLVRLQIVALGVLTLFGLALSSGAVL
jgi:hypothetical protein